MNRPRPPINGWVLFCQATRPTVRAEFPDYSPGQISNVVGDHWQELTGEGRAEWNNKASLLNQQRGL